MHVALHLAAMYSAKGVECIRLLLLFGADRSIVDVHGETAGDIAIRESREQEAHILHTFDPSNPSSLHQFQLLQDKYFVQPTRQAASPAKMKHRFPLERVLPASQV